MNAMPTVLVPVFDGKNDLTAVQRQVFVFFRGFYISWYQIFCRILLDARTSGKPQGSTWKRHKYTLGVLKNSIAVIQKGDEHCETLFLAEGPETAASIAYAFPEAHVRATLSLANMRSAAEVLINTFWKRLFSLI